VTQTTRPADAQPRHWSARAPAWAQPYARLSRYDRPVGWRLLLVPCLMGLALARAEEGFWWDRDALIALVFLIGAIAMRGAGCTYNDIVDRKIDAAVERTAGRPIPAGQVSVRAAWIWLVAQCAVGLAVLLTLPPAAILWALASLPLVALYPFMKRITWWPQAWLGLCFSWGALVAGAAVDWRITPEIALLFAGCVAWVIGYDTIYALQDIEDDALIGVRSTARLFGDRWRQATLGFYMSALLLWGMAAMAAGAGWPSVIALALIGFFFVAPMLEKIDVKSPSSALAAFNANVWIGLAAAAAFALEPLWISLRPLVEGVK
jgi:4-hydroxybenzoate polyprenyltransferase